MIFRYPKTPASALVALWLPLTALSADGGKLAEVPQPIAFERLQIQGELGQRLARNFDRLEEPKYQPDRVFLTLQQSGNWPGDTEGRTILGLTLDSQAAHRAPKYLEEILLRLPSKVNTNGFFGNILPPGIADEQQLSGHGWVLRGLCEYYLWKHDPHSLEAINRIIDNLVLPTKGLHERYPIDPKQRVHGGGASGTVSRQLGSWLVSTDIGCDFIFLDGVVQAYQVTGRKELKPLIDEMIQRFLKIDLRAIKAQTHASLTAMRALLRYYETTGDRKLLQAVAERFALYQQYAMTENYENYNWFGRPEATEPCAVVDSYLVAVGLWRWTRNPAYLTLAERIYYNGIAFEQRANGGFGTQKCSSENNPLLTVALQEAHWCCTMRGAEGLARAAQACFYTDGQGLYAIHFNDATVRAKIGSLGTLGLREETGYPFTGKVRLTITDSDLTAIPMLRLFAPHWVAQPTVKLNGRQIGTELTGDFVCLREPLKAGDVIDYEFVMQSGSLSLEGQSASPNLRKLYYGPLLLACDAKSDPHLVETPKVELLSGHEFRLKGMDCNFGTVYHLMDTAVKTDPLYQKRMIFTAASAEPHQDSAATKVSGNMRAPVSTSSTAE